MPDTPEFQTRREWEKLDRSSVESIVDSADLLTQCDSESAPIVVANLNEILVQKNAIGKRARLYSSFPVLEQQYIENGYIQSRQLSTGPLIGAKYYEGYFIGCGLFDTGTERHLTYLVAVEGGDEVVTASSLITTGRLRIARDGERGPRNDTGFDIREYDISPVLSCGEASRSYEAAVARKEVHPFKGVLAYYQGNNH